MRPLLLIFLFCAMMAQAQNPVDNDSITQLDEVILFDALKYVILIAVAFLLSTVSTSFFLPIFGTIATLATPLTTLTVASLATTLVGSVSVAVTVSVTVVVAALAVLTPGIAGIAVVVLRHCNK